MSKTLGMQLYLKKDYLQKTGSFKERGARYSLIKLSALHKKNGVITTSAGNHAQVRSIEVALEHGASDKTSRFELY